MPPPPPANAPSHASGAFRAFCTFAGRRLALGAFDTAEAAWRAEDLAALAEQLRQEEEALDLHGVCDPAEPLADEQHHGFYPRFRQDKQLMQRLAAAVTAGREAVVQCVRQEAVEGAAAPSSAIPQQVQQQQQREPQPPWQADAEALLPHLPPRDAADEAVTSWVSTRLTQPPASVPEDQVQVFLARWAAAAPDQRQEMWAALRDCTLLAIATGSWHRVAECLAAEPH